METTVKLIMGAVIGAVVAAAIHFLGYEFVSCFLLATIAYFSMGIWEHVSGWRKEWDAED